jgi:hypothetical protein
MQVQLVVFSAPKEGYAPAEWEDGAGGGSFGAGATHGGAPPRARFAVADGATETYESRRWVNLLIGSFMSPDQSGSTPFPPGSTWPELDRRSIGGWFKAMQERWQATMPATDDLIEQMKIRQGTLATFVGGQILGIDTRAPIWQAVALGDSVLFHVRNGLLVEHFPPLRSRDFASAPEGIHTSPVLLDRMCEQVLFREGKLGQEDMIFVATDAFAKWMISRIESGDRTLWPLLGELVHHNVFTQLVAAERRTGAMKDDDVTLMRIRLLAQPATTVVVCL